MVPGVPLQAFHTLTSSFTSHRSVSLQSTAAHSLGLFQNPKTVAPTCCAFKRTFIPSGECIVVVRTDWFSFHLVSHRSTVSHSALNVSSLIQLHKCSDWTPTSILPPMEGSSSPINIPVFPSSSFILLSLEVLYILFHWSGTPVNSQMVFKHFCVWRCIPDVFVERKMYSTATYTSTILFISTCLWVSIYILYIYIIYLFICLFTYLFFSLLGINVGVGLLFNS